jgi:pimeloyl-ACP methyl ester carboxylesterase
MPLKYSEKRFFLEKIMGFWGIFGIVMGVLLAGGVIAMVAYTWPIAKRVYEHQLVRTSPEKWGRVCSAPENEEQWQMWNAGLAWAAEQKEHCREVELHSEGFHLYGEYYDFGCDRAVIILPGRCESLVYSYYFAPPYQKAGFNVLVVDTRCHGKSDGRYNTIGVKESRDVLAWAKMLHEQLGNGEIYIHGICIGTAAGLFALSASDCPDYMRGLVTEGCFVSFRETFKRHMMAEHRPLFPVLDMVMLLINRHAGINVYRDTPISAIGKINPHCRMLFLYGEKDIFSIPEKSRALFAAAVAEDKKLVWFPKGGHSHLRINNLEAYDQAIVDFFKE